MKILHLSTSDIDNGGARAAYRLHKGLQSMGCDSQMLVRAKFSSDETVTAEKSVLTKLGPPASGLPMRLYPKCNSEMFSPQWFPDAIASKATHIDPDIINLHWVCNGYLQIETLPKFNKPLVWTLHDMWTFTGGCHYSQECERYKESCGACPQLHSSGSWDVSRWVWWRKVKAWKGLNLTVVSPSTWLARCAQSSSLFKHLRVEAIPNGVDTHIYRPIPCQTARELLNLLPDKQYILFGSMNPGDPRKGFQFLKLALQELAKLGWQDRVELLVLGSQPSQQSDLGLKVHYLGRLNDDFSLAVAYSAADLFVAPSVQDNLPNTVVESLACGVPCVAFKIGGMPDMIDHYQNGYLAQAFEVEDLARGIIWVLEDKERHQKLQHQAREKSLREFAKEVQARRYLSLYKEVLEGCK